MYTQENWSLYEDMQEELERFGNEYIDTFYAGGRGNYFFEHAYVDGYSVTIEYEWSCMGGHEKESVTVPLHYLWTEDWKEQEKTRLVEQSRQQAEAEETRKQEREAKRVADEKAKYMELRDKHGWDI